MKFYWGTITMIMVIWFGGSYLYEPNPDTPDGKRLIKARSECKKNLKGLKESWEEFCTTYFK